MLKGDIHKERYPRAAKTLESLYVAGTSLKLSRILLYGNDLNMLKFVLLFSLKRMAR